MKGQSPFVHGTSLSCAADFLIFSWKLTTVRLRQLHDHPSITKVAGRLFLSIVISKQLNAAPYLRHKPRQLLREETVPAVLNSRFHVCSSLAPRPMTVVFGLGTRLRVRMRTTLQNGVLRNRQQVGRAENSFINQDEFVAMKTLSGCKALRCDKHQFRDKMTVRTWTVFEISLFDKVVWTKKERKKGEKLHFRYRTLLCLAVFRVPFEHLYESCWS